MHFIKAHQTHKGMPYIFKIEPGGDFEVNSQFGSIWQHSFSIDGIVIEDEVLGPVHDDDSTSSSDQNDAEEEQSEDGKDGTTDNESDHEEVLESISAEAEDVNDGTTDNESDHEEVLESTCISQSNMPNNVDTATYSAEMTTTMSNDGTTQQIAISHNNSRSKKTLNMVCLCLFHAVIMLLTLIRRCH